MFLSESSVKDVIVAVIHATSPNRSDAAKVIKETVDELIAADRKLHAYVIEKQ